MPSEPRTPFDYSTEGLVDEQLFEQKVDDHENKELNDIQEEEEEHIDYSLKKDQSELENQKIMEEVANQKEIVETDFQNVVQSEEIFDLIQETQIEINPPTPKEDNFGIEDSQIHIETPERETTPIIEEKPHEPIEKK